MERFCAEVLGFKTIQTLQFDQIGRIIKMRRGRARIKLFGPDSGIGPKTGDDPWFASGGWRYVAIYVADQDEVLRLAQAVAGAGGQVLVDPAIHRPNACAALVADPEGNAWELLWEAPE
jgi:predicted enzyme related to lactoylglutathione lyase